MESSIILDHLISQSGGTTLYVSDNTSPQLIKEAILRGFEIVDQKQNKSFGGGISNGGGILIRDWYIRGGWAHLGYGKGTSPGAGDDSGCLFSMGVRDFYPRGSGEEKELEIDTIEMSFDPDFLL